MTVLRAGLEELLAQDGLCPEKRGEISALIHQTYRLNGVIQDLLLLSRVDAGQVRLEAGVVDLRHLVESWLDDLSALPDPHGLTIDADLPAKIWVVGEQRYTTLIVQNLLENARKYNRVGGRIAITARENGTGEALLVIGNTGQPIVPADSEHIFERFHRGSVGENVPGHGLGLNLARDLARLHGGDLRLVRSGKIGRSSRCACAWPPARHWLTPAFARENALAAMWGMAGLRRTQPGTGFRGPVGRRPHPFHVPR